MQIEKVDTLITIRNDSIFKTRRDKYAAAVREMMSMLIRLKALDNAAELLAQPNVDGALVDGALVGGAALDAAGFLTIVGSAKM